MSRSNHSESDAEQRKRAKKIYETVVSAVDKNSGNMQPPLTKRTSILASLHQDGNGRYSLEEIDRAICAACANGDLIRIKDTDGDVRIGIDDERRLVEKIASYASWVDDDRRRQDLIGLANQRVQQLRERDADE